MSRVMFYITVALGNSKDMVSVLLQYSFRKQHFGQLGGHREDNPVFCVLASRGRAPGEWGFPGDGVPGLHAALLFPVGLRCAAGR